MNFSNWLLSFVFSPFEEFQIGGSFKQRCYRHSLSDDMEKPVPLNGLFITYLPERRGHTTPLRATGEGSGLDQEAEAGISRKPKPQPLLEFLQKRRDSVSSVFLVFGFAYDLTPGSTHGARVPPAPSP